MLFLIYMALITTKNETAIRSYIDKEPIEDSTIKSVKPAPIVKAFKNLVLDSIFEIFNRVKLIKL